MMMFSKRKRRVGKKRNTGGKRSLVGTADITYRSNAERRCGDLLQSLDKTMQYEPKKFDIVVPQRYVPDFYLPLFDVWLEFKGTFEQKSREKCQAFFDDGYNLVIVLQQKDARMFDRMKTNEQWLDAMEIPYVRLYQDHAKTTTHELRRLHERLTIAKSKRILINQEWLINTTKEIRDNDTTSAV